MAYEQETRGGTKTEFPSYGEEGKCELRVNQQNKLYCEQLPGCTGRCILYSIPNDQPEAEGRVEDTPTDPDSTRYYYCRCLEL